MTGPRRGPPTEHRWFRVVAVNGVVNRETTGWTTLSDANDHADAYRGLASSIKIECTEDGGKTTTVHRVVEGEP